MDNYNKRKYDKFIRDTYRGLDGMDKTAAALALSAIAGEFVIKEFPGANGPGALILVTMLGEYLGEFGELDDGWRDVFPKRSDFEEAAFEDIARETVDRAGAIMNGEGDD